LAGQVLWGPRAERTNGVNIDMIDCPNGVVILRLEGRLNMVTAPAMREAVRSIIESGRTRVAVDLAGVDFLDSSGLGALLSGRKTARNAGGDLRIAAATEQVRLVLNLTNLERVLTPFGSVDEAYGDD
jgi:anti-sigma B factor antagonist